ncbi:MAG: hypothetical protein OXH57_07755 [Ekhidna sp.]|nr:hypothetical protein [Ekhidna sp.]
MLSSWIVYHFIQTDRDTGDTISHAIPVLILFSISLLGLKVALTKDQISFQWIWIGFFFEENIIPMNAITELRVVRYTFLEGGLGYGIRYSTKYGNVHNVRGNVGISIKTKKSKLLLGIQKEKATRAFIFENFPKILLKDPEND